MAEDVIAPLILEPVGRSTSQSRVGNVAPLILPSLTTSVSRDADWTYELRRIDANGRVSGRTILKVLGWARGTALTADVTDGEALLQPGNGKDRVSNAGDLWLGYRTRRALRLSAGDPTFLAGSASSGTLLLWTLPMLDAVVQAHLGDRSQS